MRVHVYLLAPIETWPGWISEDEFHRRLHDVDNGVAHGESCWARYKEMRDRGFKAAEQLGWFGDVASGPYVAGLPVLSEKGEASMMVAWRRGQDGQTFVVSPMELPWLRDDPRCASVDVA